MRRYLEQQARESTIEGMPTDRLYELYGQSPCGSQRARALLDEILRRAGVGVHRLANRPAVIEIDAAEDDDDESEE